MRFWVLFFKRVGRREGKGGCGKGIGGWEGLMERERKTLKRVTSTGDTRNVEVARYVTLCSASRYYSCARAALGQAVGQWVSRSFCFNVRAT